jgi:hypothetical protein
MDYIKIPSGFSFTCLARSNSTNLRKVCFLGREHIKDIKSQNRDLLVTELFEPIHDQQTFPIQTGTEQLIRLE